MNDIFIWPGAAVSREQEGDQRAEPVTRLFEFTWAIPLVRYVKFHVTGTKQFPDRQPSAGGGSWVFIDEIVVR